MKKIVSNTTRLRMPRFGCSHFRSDVKKIRRGQYTTVDAITDIMDNVRLLFQIILTITYNSDGFPHSIVISDNDPDGFGPNIESDGPENPLNMGHESRNHENDSFTSEFGVGLKESALYLGNKLIIVTRIKRVTGEFVCIKVAFDFPEMEGRENPEDSREPTDFRIISQEEYQILHTNRTGFDCGSSIIIESPRISNDTLPNIEGLITHIKKTYWEKIKQGKTIKVNGQSIEPDDDMFDNQDCGERRVERYICTNIENGAITDVLCKEIKGEQVNYLEVNPSSGRIGVCRQQSKINFIESEIVGRDAIYMKSTNSVRTDYENVRGKNALEFIRDNRFHGIGIEDDTRDGYGNHITNKLYWNSKIISPYLGIGSTKGQIIPKKNNLVNFLQKILTRNRCSSSKWYSLHPSAFPPTSDPSPPTPVPLPAPVLPPTPPVPPPPPPPTPNPIPSPTPEPEEELTLDNMIQCLTTWHTSGNDQESLKFVFQTIKQEYDMIFN